MISICHLSPKLEFLVYMQKKMLLNLCTPSLILCQNSQLLSNWLIRTTILLRIWIHIDPVIRLAVIFFPRFLNLFRLLRSQRFILTTHRKGKLGCQVSYEKCLLSMCHHLSRGFCCISAAAKGSYCASVVCLSVLMNIRKSLFFINYP